MRQRRHHPACALVGSRLVLGLALAAPSAHAQQVAIDGYSSVPVQSGATLSLWGSQPHQPGSYALALGLEVRSPRSAAGLGAATDALSGSVSSFELLGSLGVWRSIDVSAAIALDRASTRAPDAVDGDTQSRGALGELRFIPRARLLGVDEGSALALLAPIGLPSKSNGLYAARGVRVEPRLAGTLHGGWLIATTNVGYTLHGAEPELGTGSANFVSGGVGAEFRIVPAWSMLAELTARWSPHDRTATTVGGLSTETHVAARFSSSGWAAQFGGGTGLTSALLEPDWRLLATVSFSPVAADAAPPSRPVEPAPTESDESYLNETSDWEAAPAAEDAAAEEPVKPSVAAAAPTRAEPAVAATIEEEEIAKLERALARASTAEPRVAKRRPTNGASKASARANGEGLKRALAGVPAALPEIDDVVHFAPNQMRLSGPQIAALQNVAAQLEAAPADAHLVVEGHSDGAGPRAFNWRLSRMRASTVRFHLIEAGIGWRRISVQAYGASRPREPDAEDSDSQSDRRVEFRLIRSAHRPGQTP